jgi:hypothetical protein
LVEDTTHSGEKSHVGHAICLIDNDKVNFAQVDGSLLDEIFETSWGGDKNIDTVTEGVLLGAISHTAVDGEHVTVDRSGEGGQLLLDLLGQFSRWCENKGSWSLPGRFTDHCEEWKAKGESLARTCRRFSTHVSPGEGIGDGGLLDGERFGDLAFSERLHKRIGQPEMGERGRHDFSLPHSCGAPSWGD